MGEDFAGTIDEVRIYRGALTDAQVQQDMITPVDPVDSTTPTVSITSPAAGASITGSLTLTATAADNVAVAGVRFELDGSSIGAEDLTSPYALVWNSSTAPNGSHLLTAIARDTSGNLKTSAAVSVTVSNDSVPPTVGSIPPPNGAASVALGASVTATFSEAINAATLTTTTFVLRNPANAVVPATVSYNAGTRVATLTPSAALTTSTTSPPRSPEAPRASRTWPAMRWRATTVWSFATIPGDTTPPTVTSATPANGASSVALGTAVTATFSEAINAATLTTTTVVLRNPANAVVPAAVSYNAGTRVATLTPSAALTTSTTYTATITGGAAGVKDVAGNALASSVVWSFATILGDTTPPTVTSATPANGATDVGTTTLVTATFDEPMAAASITTTTFELKNAAGAVVPSAVTYDAAGRTATLTPSAALTPGVTFTATIMGGAGGVRDVAGNVATGHTAWSFAVAVQTFTGPVAVYGFDEGMGSVLRDLSGNELDGTILGATWQSGRFGKSLEFNGVNDWVTIPANSLLDLTTAVTVEAWVYPTALTAWNTVVFKETPTGHTYALYADGDSLGAGGHMQVGLDAKAHQTTALPIGQWSHLTTTFDGQSVRLFVNAIEVASTPASGPLDVSGNALRIGGNSVWGEHFVGRIDEVRLYGRALSAAEIATDMGTPAGGWLAAAYGFDETAGSTAADASGHLLTGVVTAATWTAGRFGNGLRFNGTDSWVTVPHSNWLDLTTGLTLEAWVYPTNGGGWRTVVLKEAAGGHTFALYSDDGVAPGAHLQAATDVISRGTVPLPLETWTHLAATYDGTRLRLYTNGVLTSNLPVAGVPVTSTGVLRIGGNAIWGEHFAGIIDEVRIYYRALTAAEISADMNYAHPLTRARAPSFRRRIGGPPPAWRRRVTPAPFLCERLRSGESGARARLVRPWGDFPRDWPPVSSPGPFRSLETRGFRPPPGVARPLLKPRARAGSTTRPKKNRCPCRLSAVPCPKLVRSSPSRSSTASC